MKAIKIIGVALVLLLLITACENPIAGINSGTYGATNPDGNVIIRIAGSSGRTVLPKNPVFGKFEIILQKEGDDSPLPTLVIEDASLITGEGVAVQLSAGTWSITLKAYQQHLGKTLLAAIGSDEIQVKDGDRAKTVAIILNTLAIDTATEPGVFSYTVMLPPGIDTAVLSLKNSEGDAVEGYGDLDLTIEENLIGSMLLAPGYYDLSVIIAKNGQSAGLFESVHIYSGLESPASLDLSVVEFADKVYIMGTLDGIRLGTVQVTNDPAGNNAIGMPLELDGSLAVRSANWIIEVPSSYAGTTVYAVQKFNGETNIAAIDSLPINGAWDVKLRLTPAVPPTPFNAARWYAELTASGGEDSLAQAADGSVSTWWQSERHEENGSVWLKLDFGFPVAVNAGRLVFYANSGNNSVLINEYNVEYLNGDNWVLLVNRSHALEGSTDGSVSYGDFFAQTVTAQQFRWLVPAGSVENAPALFEFGLYQTADRADLSAAIPLAQKNHDDTLVSVNGDGEEIQRIDLWVTATVKETYQAAIDAAQAVCNDLFSTAQDIANALTTLNTASSAFNSAKQLGNLDDISVNAFNVQDGYADKFVVTWLREPTYIYRLSMTSTGNIWNQIAEFPEIKGSTEAQMFTYEVTDIGAGQTRSFKIQAYVKNEDDQEAGGKNAEYSGAKVTMGVPVLSLANNGPSHHTVSLSWTVAQKADAYRIVYSIAGDNTSPHAVEVAASALTWTSGSTTYSFRPNGCNNPIILGRQITIYVEALNKALYQQQDEKCPVADVTTKSNDVATRLVGPAELSAAATQAAAADNIKLSWSPVSGAGGYYVFRTVTGAETIAYYVPTGSGALAVTGKNVAAAETTTVKASASFAADRFTLTDTWMNDSEYNGAYSDYTANYKNQQNDLARGNAYRYFIVPVAASTDTVQFNVGNVSYSITSGGETIQYSGATAFEKTGFTVGYGQNVAATKGSYASSGNVNNGIQITWNAPSLLAGTGVTPQYTLYRREYNGSWEAAGTTGDLQYVSTTETRGIVYEYAVGVNGSLPHTSSRFMSDSRAQVDDKGVPKGYGFMQEMVKLQGVTRGEDAYVNSLYGEKVTLYKNSNQYYNMGIDGYKTEVMNRNISKEWLELGHVPTEGLPTAETQEITHVNHANFKVLRDYKHFHKVRSFVWSNGEGSARIYCPDPTWTYQYRYGTTQATHIAASEQMQDDYVKWGARQITKTEFITIASLYFARGQDRAIGTGTWPIADKTGNASANWGGSGRMVADYTYNAIPSYTHWEFKFENYKDDLQTRADDWMTFITLNGKAWARCGVVNTRPQRYRENGRGWLDVIGPWDTPHLYTGRIMFGHGNDDANTNLKWGSGSGNIPVEYPLGATREDISFAGSNTALDFTNQSSNGRLNTDAWK